MGGIKANSQILGGGESSSENVPTTWGDGKISFQSCIEI